jgi:hypothetical protein
VSLCFLQRSVVLFAALACAGLPVASAAEEYFDRLGQALSVSTPDGNIRARLSGTVDLEAYHLPSPAPAFFYTPRRDFFNPRLALFLDTQFGRRAYFFSQARADHGFDPGESAARYRFDEYALRLTPWTDGRFNLQVGKFSTSIGNWMPRHTSWENPFISAPIPYEHTTGVWDTETPRSLNQFLLWNHVRPGLSAFNTANEKRFRLPVVWGPAYATGAAVSGALGKFRYSAEVKNAGIASRPASWTKDGKWWTYPAVAARLAYTPNPMWMFGASAANSTYLRPSAQPTITPGRGRGDYRQRVFGADAGFAWHHWQLWAEAFHSRFEIPLLGPADTISGYVEAKYKFTPQLFGSVRFNRQTFGTLADGPRPPIRWGRNFWRIDIAPGYRFTPHLQLKFEYSLQNENADSRERAHTLSTQLTARF